MTATVAPRVRAILDAGYGLTAGRIRRVWSGTQTDNVRAELTDGRAVFVKIYRQAANLTYERQIIGTTVQLTTAGIPTTTPVPSASGSLLHIEADVALSVWQWIDAAPPTTLSLAQADALGQVTARMHRTLDQLRHMSLPISAERCRSTAPGEIAARTEHLLDVISARVHRDRTDEANGQRLRQRLADLEHVDRLRAGLPPLRLRPVHGDLTTTNTLFDRSGRLAAVIDLRLQHADRAREVGRIAFDPRPVAHRDDWQQIGLAAVRAYHQQGGPATDDEIVSSARLALLHALCSTYGVEEHYLHPRPPRIQKSLDRYFADRHTLIRRLLHHLPQVEDHLAALAANRTGEPATAKGARR